MSAPAIAKAPIAMRRQCRVCTFWFNSESRWDTACDDCLEREGAAQSKGKRVAPIVTETRPPSRHKDREFHWLTGERASSPVPVQWIGGNWYSPGERGPISPAEMYRRGWRWAAPTYVPVRLRGRPT